jgi:hypothetical protein
MQHNIVIIDNNRYNLYKTLLWVVYKKILMKDTESQQGKDKIVETCNRGV